MFYQKSCQVFNMLFINCLQICIKIKVSDFEH